MPSECLNSDSDLVELLESQMLSEPCHEDVDAEYADTGEWIKRTYRKLHRIAFLLMNREVAGHTLSATSLVHEVFLRLRSRDSSTWLNERQFLAIVSSEMRRVLIDTARKKKSSKRGGSFVRHQLDYVDSPDQVADSIVELNEAIDEFEKQEPVKAELVRLRYFLGLSEIEASEAIGVSRATASRYWTFARAWLLDYLSD